VGLGRRFALLSRETLLLLNNLLLAVAAATVLLGTLYPLVVDALGLGKISVGAPYFEAVFVPLMVPLLLLAVLGPVAAWKQAGWAEVARQLRWVALTTLLLTAAGALAWHFSLAVALGLGLGVWVLLGTAATAWQRLRANSAAGTPWPTRLRRQPASWWGMLLAHAGLALFVLGVTGVRGLETGGEHSLRLGQVAELDGYRFAFVDLRREQGPNYVAARARFEVSRHGEAVATLFPEKRLYLVQQMPMTEAAVDRGLLRDLYVSLGEATPDGAWVVRVQHKPFMNWLWAGVLLIALGGALAALDRRYRQRSPA
jgi:cytochrome c-type biogenesis protein CcmF